MISSMTGFARVQTAKKEGGWTFECRSINHRYFDCSLKLPADLASFENQIRALIQAAVPRGKITIGISQDGDPGRVRTLSLDEKAAKFYLKELQHLRKKLRLKGDVDFSELIQLPGVLISADAVQETDSRQWGVLKKSLEKTLKVLQASRRVEGAKLAKDLQSRLTVMHETVIKIKNLTEGRMQAVYERLKVRMRDLLGDTQTDEERLYREAALMAEKGDITEETVRLKSHFDLFSKKLAADGQAGRELDFLCQEMHREVNTIGSKAQLFEISREVVFLKSEIEKLREQVQNVE